jgi:fucose permease
VIFSVSAGLSEVLLSPMIAAMPSDNPQRDMSFLHSLYAFGVVTMVLLSTAFLGIFGKDSWAYLVMLLAALPLIAALLFALSPMPDMSASVAEGGTRAPKKQAIGLLLSVLCIFFGSCAENAMSSWISGYMESALGIDKSLGDVFGVAMFAVLLGVARITYSRFGRRIEGVLLVGMIGAAVCYLVAALIPITAVAFAACILTGLFTAMLWPGALIFMEENVPGAGVGAFALMAAGGDFGASVAPQLLGAIADSVSESGFGMSVAEQLGIGADQLGLKAGMLVCSVFPVLGAVTVAVTVRYFRKSRAENKDI